MNIAIVGAGISGLTAAYQLNEQHRITVFEAAAKIGGHTNTVDVEGPKGRVAIDTGFIVFNDRTYPNFCRMMDRLGVESQTTTMSFSVRCESTGLEYRGADLNGMFAQRSNLVRPSWYRFLADLVRFNREARELLADDIPQETVKSFFARRRYGDLFIEKYFLPMGAAIWSCPPTTFEQFPIRFILEFYRNHGLLAIKNRPDWRVIRGGSGSYLDPLTRSFHDRIRTEQPVTAVARTSNGVRLATRDQEFEFDHVVFACHSDQALRMLGTDATPREREMLGSFPYQKSIAVLHTDPSLLPKQKRAWACWNYLLPARESVARAGASVTYNMNLLQNLDLDTTYCVTLNQQDRIDPSRVIREFTYHHPVFTLQRDAIQARHNELINRNNTSFCGAYWGNGFHEDGVNSALKVAHSLNTSLEPVHCNEQLPV